MCVTESQCNSWCSMQNKSTPPNSKRPLINQAVTSGTFEANNKSISHPPVVSRLALAESVVSLHTPTNITLPQTMLSSTSSIVQLAKAPFKRAQRGLFGGTCSLLFHRFRQSATITFQFRRHIQEQTSIAVAIVRARIGNERRTTDLEKASPTNSFF